ncbi:protein DpdF [Paenibacillus sp. LS1]|uniref:protein DpdF n=1 Tax=Paenibacillus sp. LS1 TaxID=2992120 RepID=UPI002230C7DE|nr:protein DpdF [Paenibacillus sp. LS1]MCW3795387.1 protein DpdF [Paenibacillus sp. LS1]
MNEWDELRSWLDKQNIDPPKFENPFFLRFALAVKEGVTGLDLAVIIRGVLRTESEQNQGQRIILKLPNISGWPTPEMYREVGIQILEEHEDGYLLYAESWKPDWLTYQEGDEPDRPLYGLVKRTHLKTVSGDPFLKVSEKKSYRCSSQRDAMRTILTAPEDATLLINLPTGTGKSLCGQLPALMMSQQEGVTVVVVPTIALALDQERALMPLIEHPMAYFSSPSRAQQNEEIKNKIKNGTQRIIFASPESVLNSLNSPLQIAAKKGYLKMLVIDEAHTVDGWGEGFRPAFQELAGWRRMIRRISVIPFRTLLLSATVTESCHELLETLFGDSGFKSFSAVTLRPEPAYWISKCYSDQEKMKKLLDAVHHLPRPLIIYTTEVADAVHLYSELRRKGYKRIEVFHGQTVQSSREKIIEDWQERRIDMVVATSAFGLGVDQTEVRAVIHACVPEGVDRFYQEVGRGGRDGRACMSLLLYDYEDIEKARKINSPKLIGIDKARSRWERMFANRQPVTGHTDMFLLPITISPGVEPERIDTRNDYNEQWHLKTLTMLARLGVLEFDWEEATDRNSSIGGENWRFIRMLRHDHKEDEFWDEVEEYRTLSKRISRGEIEAMERLLKSEECVAHLIQEVYSISNSEKKDEKIFVARACGGCPACREVRNEPSMPALNSYPLQWPVSQKIKPMLRNYLDPVRNQLILYRTGAALNPNRVDLKEKLTMFRTIRWFANQGIQHIVAQDHWLDLIREDETLSKRLLLFTSEINDYARLARLHWKVPTLVIHEKKEDDALVFRWMSKEADSASPVIFFIPEDMEHPMRREYHVRDLTDIRSYLYEAFRKEVSL